MTTIYSRIRRQVDRARLRAFHAREDWPLVRRCTALEQAHNAFTCGRDYQRGLDRATTQPLTTSLA